MKRRASKAPAIRAKMTSKREIWLSAEEVQRACRQWVSTTYANEFPDAEAVAVSTVIFDMDVGHEGAEFEGARVIVEDVARVLATDPEPDEQA